MGFLHLPDLGTVHYHEYGTGNKPLLAFHGYGMTGKQFHVLQKSLLGKYHVYGFDHFFHGESKLEGWTEQQILAGMNKTMVRAYLEAWFKVFGRQRISLMAYSIGANFALILLEDYADMVDEVILMAPDGLAGYEGFKFLQHHSIGRAIFKTISKSNWLAPKLLKALKKIRVIDQSLYTIAYNEVDTPKKREDVFYTLNLIRHLKPDIKKVAEQVNRYNIKCVLIFGRDDLLFPKKPAMQAIELLDGLEVHEVPMGHWLVTAALDAYLCDAAQKLANNQSRHK
ncbi:alpha/beta fold hydrolase [Mucilaginibacter paludis]|uniref:Alpha/beta hydrolase fold containing protein n=1 Tax=Mucilaginibacter paludis DSM 18603 TaxID=714943 RepID=H1YGM0_9SPHI|nr:alpha/beta hydrolase [Mucilaginibacter paludis]EHQ25406.1 alpha/beta hydrolase fold containing protein [Mucilaginibacter paludis DSM 18603]